MRRRLILSRDVYIKRSRNGRFRHSALPVILQLLAKFRHKYWESALVIRADSCFLLLEASCGFYTAFHAVKVCSGVSLSGFCMPVLEQTWDLHWSKLHLQVCGPCLGFRAIAYFPLLLFPWMKLVLLKFKGVFDPPYPTTPTGVRKRKLLSLRNQLVVWNLICLAKSGNIMIINFDHTSCGPGRPGLWKSREPRAVSALWKCLTWPEVRTFGPGLSSARAYSIRVFLGIRIPGPNTATGDNWKQK